MKKALSIGSIACIIMLLLPGCQAIGDIFKAGVWTGIIIVALVVGIIIYFATRSSGK